MTKLNKIIKKVLKEAVGVPDNIIETSKQIYQQIVGKVKDSDIIDEENLNFNLTGDYRISDYRFKKIDLEIEMIKTDKVDIPTLAGMSFRFNSKLDDVTLKQVHLPEKNKINLTITIGIPEEDNFLSIQKLFDDEKQQIITSLSHELMHAYEMYKKKISSPQERASYESYKNVRFGIEPIDDFLHKLYFIHSIENVVRPTEIASDLEQENIDRGRFLEFLKNNRVYGILKKINNFTYEGLKEELLEHVDTIRLRLDQSGIDDIPEDDKELVEKILDLLMSNIINAKGSVFRDELTTDFIEQLFGFNSRKEEVFNNYLKKIQKYDNYNDFFKNEEKMFKTISSRLMKKIHKLYSLLKDKSTNESIIDWDLHHKLKKTPTIIETENNYLPEERKLKLIQKYLDNVLTPRNELIHDAKVYRFINRDEYAVTIWVNTERPLNRDEYDGLVDDTWEEIYNMFDVPVSIRRIPMNR
jgi:hypothetical protein